MQDTEGGKVTYPKSETIQFWRPIIHFQHLTNPIPISHRQMVMELKFQNKSEPSATLNFIIQRLDVFGPPPHKSSASNVISTFGRRKKLV